MCDNFYSKDDIIIDVNGNKKNGGTHRGHIHILGMSLGLISVLVYLLISVIIPSMWGKLWVIIILVPVIDSLTDAILAKNIKLFNFSALVVFAYLTIGIFFGLWHPTWIMFALIPVWACLVKGVKFFEIR